MAEEKDIKKGFAGLQEKLAGVLTDLATLQVTTYTGNLTLTADKVLKRAGDKPIGLDTKAMLSLLGDQAKTRAELKLLGYTFLDIDSDAVAFIKEDLNEQQQGLLEGHKAMVASAQEARMSFLQFVKELVKN